MKHGFKIQKVVTETSAGRGLHVWGDPWSRTTFPELQVLSHQFSLRKKTGEDLRARFKFYRTNKHIRLSLFSLSLFSQSLSLSLSLFPLSLQCRRWSEVYNFVPKKDYHSFELSGQLQKSSDPVFSKASEIKLLFRVKPQFPTEKK